MELFDLAGHVSVITGGNRGIGLGMARGLAKAGARVAIWSRAEDRNRAAVAEIESLGGEALAFSCNVADEVSVAEAMEATLEGFGFVNSLFANAGTSGFGKFPSEFALEEWQRVIDVNLTGAFLTTRIVANHLVERGEGGSIILTSSVVSRMTIPLAPHYTASKGAILSLGRALANRLGRNGIRVNVLSPGWVDTEMGDPVISNERSAEYYMQRIPLRRWGDSEDFGGSSGVPGIFGFSVHDRCRADRRRWHFHGVVSASASRGCRGALRLGQKALNS